MRSRRNGSNGGGNGTPVVRAAIYTRKSTDEGLDREFNSLDAQREAAEAYIKSQAGNGWIALPDRFDDGGFSGGNLERPALKRLLTDIAADKVDRIVVYKVDRLSRAILDFARLAETLEQHGVGIVSVTQQMDTSTSMGRLTLNMLLSFAQFEREMVSDRTRDKLRAARRKGKFVGGGLILGYDRHPDGGRLVVNEPEAEHVRKIFGVFIETQSLIETVQEVNGRGWTLKRWTTKDDRLYGGGTFDVHNLRRMLTNHAYVGEVAFDGQIVPAEHEAVVDRETWEQAQALIGTRDQPRTRSTRSASLLAGLLRCEPCQSAMSPCYSQNRNRRYPYYRCGRAYRRGAASCPSKGVPAPAIERFVIDQIRAIGRDPELVAATVTASREALSARRAELEAEIRDTQKALDCAHSAARAQIADAYKRGPRRRPDEGTDPDVHELEERLTRLRDEQTSLRGLRIAPADLTAALAAFDPLWEHLTSAERQRIVQLLIQQIDYHGAEGKVVITFRPEGVRLLAVERGAAEAGA